MLEKYVFPYIRKWCVVGGLCLAFPWVAYAQQQKISLNIQNVTLKQAMEQIKEQAVVNVAYSKEFVDPKMSDSVSWIIVFFYTIKRNKTVRELHRKSNKSYRSKVLS